MPEKQYWIRTEQGRVWGPYGLSALDRLRGQLTEKAEASLDGRNFLPGLDFPELRALLTAERAAAPAPQRERTPTGEVYISPALRAMFGEASGRQPTPPPQPRVAAPAPAAASPKPSGPPVMRPVVPPVSENLDLSDQGNLADLSPVRLYSLAALGNASGSLELQLESGRTITVSFRRGTPDHVSSDDPELSLLRFLQSRKIVSAEQALKAEEHARSSGGDVVAALFQLQLIPPTDTHKLLGDYAVFLLDRALQTWRGTFSFRRDAPSPPGAFPLGQKWVLLAEAVRRLDLAPLRARLEKRLASHVQRSGGSSIGKIEELALTAQESRIYASVDGTRTGGELLDQHGAAVVLRLLFLLTELKHLSFGEAVERAAPPPEPPAPPAPQPVTSTAPEPPKPAPPPRAPRPPPAPRAPPPVVQQAPKAPPPPPKPPAPVRTYATPPPEETPQAQLARLRGLLTKLEQATHYEALGLDRKAAAADVKKAFVLLARDLHPDTVTDPAQGELRAAKERLFARVNEAAQVLGDEARRKEYEAELAGDKKDVDVGRIFDAEEKFQRAEILIKARKYKEGLALLDEAIQLNDQEAEFYAWRGYARFLLASDRKHAFEECAADVKKALRLVDKCLPAHLFLGHMHKIVGDLKSAASSYQRVLQLDDKHVEAQRELRLMGKKA